MAVTVERSRGALSCAAATPLCSAGAMPHAEHGGIICLCADKFSRAESKAPSFPCPHGVEERGAHWELNGASQDSLGLEALVFALDLGDC